MLLSYITYIVVFIVIFIIFYILFSFWSHFYISDVPVDKHTLVIDKFRIILTIISTIASVVFGSAVVLQVLNFSNQRKTEEIEYYSKLSREFLDEILMIFLSNHHSDMVYFYNDLFQIDKINSKTKRNLNKEHMISTLIFSKLAKFAIFSTETTNYDAKIKVQKWIGHIIDTMMGSEVLREFWTDEYKPKISGPATQAYMKEHFKL
jgi:ribosomal protein L30E